MKKLVFGLIATVMFGFEVNAQTSNSSSKIKIACYTLSCCGIGPIGIEIWSVKRCHYVYTADVTSKNQNSEHYKLEFETNENVNNLIFENDVILANSEDDDGNVIILPKGEYEVKDNSITFEANKIKIKKVCIEETNSGQFLGHEYNYTITICAYYIGWGKKATLTITPKFSDEELIKLKEFGNFIEFDKDLTIKVENFNFTLNKGKYYVNEDGNIYLENVQLE
jgi:fructose-1,6-bisphosphatase